MKRQECGTAWLMCHDRVIGHGLVGGHGLLGCLALVLALLSPRPGLEAQASGHERLGVAPRRGSELSLGLGFALARWEETWGRGLGIDAAAKLGLLLDNGLSLALEIPASSRLKEEGGTGPDIALAPGDPELELGWSRRLADWRLALALSWRMGLGVWEPYQVEAQRIRSGSGWPALGTSLTVSRILDPAVIGAGIAAQLSLERPERYASRPGPLGLSLALFATQALNPELAISAGLSQGLRWRRDQGGPQGGPSWSATGQASLIVVLGSWSLRCSLSRSLSESDARGVLGLDFARSVRLGGP